MTAGQKESADGIPIGSEHCLRIFEKNKKKTALNGVQKGGHSLNTLTVFFYIFDDIPTYTYLALLLVKTFFI